MKKGYLKSLQTEEQFRQELKKAVLNDLNFAQVKAVLEVAKKKGFKLEAERAAFGL